MKITMRTIRRICQILFPVALSLVLIGCDSDNPLVLSAQPLYADQADMPFDSALIGTWVDAEGGARFAFEKEGDNAYSLVITEIDTSDGTETAGSFDAHQVRLGAFTFLDFYPRSPQAGDDFYRLHLLPVHSFARMWWEGSELHMALFSGSWLKERIEEKSVDTDNREVDDSILLTAPTREVQDLVYRFAADEHAFPDPFILHPMAENGPKE
jgi:hypothetical protein